MQIKMLTIVSGLRDGKPWPPVGGVIDVDASEASMLCSQHMAVPAYDPEARVETAVVSDMVGVEAREALVPSPSQRTRTRDPRVKP